MSTEGFAVAEPVPTVWLGSDSPPLSRRWHPAFTDITAKGADKGEGIRALAAHMGLDLRYTMAFGDGGNDSSMIKAAGIGVAMGNALESLKQEADYTTTSVDEDGVMNALRHYKLIGTRSPPAPTIRPSTTTLVSVDGYASVLLVSG